LAAAFFYECLHSFHKSLSSFSPPSGDFLCTELWSYVIILYGFFLSLFLHQQPFLIIDYYCTIIWDGIKERLKDFLPI
jgi:hypothetical protein